VIIEGSPLDGDRFDVSPAGAYLVLYTANFAVFLMQAQFYIAILVGAFDATREAEEATFSARSLPAGFEELPADQRATASERLKAKAHFWCAYRAYDRFAWDAIPLIERMVSNAEAAVQRSCEERGVAYDPSSLMVSRAQLEAGLGADAANTAIAAHGAHCVAPELVDIAVLVPQDELVHLEAPVTSGAPWRPWLGSVVRRAGGGGGGGAAPSKDPPEGKQDVRGPTLTLASLNRVTEEEGGNGADADEKGGALDAPSERRRRARARGGGETNGQEGFDTVNPAPRAAGGGGCSGDGGRYDAPPPRYNDEGDASAPIARARVRTRPRDHGRGASGPDKDPADEDDGGGYLGPAIGTAPASSRRRERRRQAMRQREADANAYVYDTHYDDPARPNNFNTAPSRSTRSTALAI